MDSLHRLTEYFREFPGIGPRQAQRFVYFLLTRKSAELAEMAKLILDIKKNIRICSSCFRFYPDGKTTLCSICSDKNRDNGQLMIISRDVDFESIEKSHVYHGLYFILGGTIPILEKEPEKRVRLKELKNRITRFLEDKSSESKEDDNSKNSDKKDDDGDKTGEFSKEIILSLNITADGENTADYVKQFIQTNFPANFQSSSTDSGLKISILGRGLSTGSELEYTDSETIKSALENRR
ncbi:MAG TPA: toprim domain-containing protein [Candidatus Paceibacterota bacterium]